MLKKFERKKIIIIIVLILLIVGLIELYDYWHNWNINIEASQKMQEIYPELQIDYTKKDTYNVFMDLMINSKLNMIQLILPLLVIIPGIISFHNLLKSGMFKDLIIRSSYKKVLLKEILKCYLPIIIIPLFLIFIFILSFLFSGHFDIQYTYDKILGLSMNFRYEYMNMPILFMAIYIMNITLVCLFFVNISLLFINKNKNILLTILFSFLTIIAYQIITEVFFGTILASLFDNSLFYNLFSLYNLWVYDGTNLVAVTLYILSLVISSGFLVYLNFKNKEKVIIENEK